MMLKFKKLEKRLVAKVGMYMSYGSTVYKIIAVGKNGIFFAFIVHDKVCTTIDDDYTLEEQEGMKEEDFIDCLHKGTYKLEEFEGLIDDKLVQFKLE